MKKLYFLSLMAACCTIHAQLPKPDHILLLMFQNKGYSQIVGSANAPYINSLLADTNTAVFTQSYALTHPSQPNYLMLYSGYNQGVTTDNIPSNTPFTNCNLGASLIGAGFSFTGYSEDMPSAGYLGTSTSLYYRKHNPWSDWQGTEANSVPASANQPFSSFPANYSLLPNVSFVVPNIINCMHNGTIQQGDTWFQGHLDSYVQWARRNNSLLIVTFDEDDGNENNHILTFFYGPMVKQGSYPNTITHYNILRTIEDIYSLGACGNSATSQPINYVWKPVKSGVHEVAAAINSCSVRQGASDGQMSIRIHTPTALEGMTLSVTDMFGRTVRKDKMNLQEGENTVDLFDITTGVYLVNLSCSGVSCTRKVLVE